MTTETPILDKIKVSIDEFKRWSPRVWDAVTEARCAPGTCAAIMHESLPTERFLRDDIKAEWVCGGQQTELEIEGKPLFMDVFYREGTLAFNGPKGPLSVSNIPFVSL